MRTAKKIIRKKESKFIMWLKGPFRALAGARDLYVRTLTSGVTGNMMYGNAMGCPTPQSPYLSRSSSGAASSPAHYMMTRSSKEEDMRDLIRAASARSLAQKINAHDDLLRSRSATSSPLSGGGRRSNVAAIGRIDEEEPCEFADDVGLSPDVYSRSQCYAYAVPRRSKIA